MTTYSIRIEYTTGNSEHSERATEEVGMNWQNIDQAKKALQHIKGHYEAYQEFYRNCRFQTSSIQEEPWYHGPIDDSFPDSWQGTIVVEKDDGSQFAIDAFWVGHFESLHVAEVCMAISDTESNDMRIFF